MEERLFPHPCALSRRFTVGPLDRVYTDGRGRRIVADHEGPGTYVVQQGKVEGVADGQTVTGRSGTFSEYFVAWAPEGEPVETDVLAHAPESVVWEKSNGREEGSGWARTESGFLFPYFDGFEDPRVGEVARGNLVARSLLELDADDGDRQKEIGYRTQNASDLFDVEDTLVRYHLNAIRFRLEVPSGCVGLRLRRSYDAFHGRQRARLRVGGKVAGWWYEPEENRRHRIQHSEAGIADEFLAVGGANEIAIDPPAGTPLFSLGSLQVLALFRLD